MKEKIEGYWWSKTEPQYPMPEADILTQEEAEEISRLIEIKEQEAEVLRYKGMTTSRITGERMGSTEFILDDWVWPVDFRPHYVLEHKVKPTDDFLRFIGYL